MTETKGLVNKTVDFQYKGKRLAFELSHALFSSFAIDAGTRLLLKETAHDPVIGKASLILDAGCGAGIIGISLAAANPGVLVVMQDRDTLACEFSLNNCRKNGIPAALYSLDGTIRESDIESGMPASGRAIIRPGLLAEDDPISGYDAVLSNVPAKAGPKILAAFFDACEKSLLRPCGRLAFVIVNSLIDVAESWCLATSMQLIGRTTAKSHTVFILEKSGPTGIPAETAASTPGLLPAAEVVRAVQKPFDSYSGEIDAYIRSTAWRPLGRYAAEVDGFWGLAEFDTASYSTDIAIEALESATSGLLVREFLVAEPGIGLAALWAAKALGPSRIVAISRNLLSLLATSRNLAKLEEPRPRLFPCAATEIDRIPGASIDCALWFCDEVPEYNYMTPTLSFLQRVTKKGAAIVVVGSTVAVSRFERARPKGLQRVSVKKRKGFSALTLAKID